MDPMKKFTKEYFIECGKRGGLAKSAKKAAAARINGTKPKRKK